MLCTAQCPLYCIVLHIHWHFCAVGNFQPGEEGCILKKYCQREAECLSELTKDEYLGAYAPDYHGIVDKEGERYTRMQDLLLAFDCPSVMDCKMGVR